ncbi:MAG: tetratricopeptide repeat protein [Rubripirellula sp.]|nr:tetratricopeptide repeat protein [Rubripirellula sp.]
MSDRYGRIQLLLTQRRYEMAERDLRSMLTEEPRDATALAMLSLCIIHLPQRLAEATEIAQRAVGIAPDESFTHYALAVCFLRRNRNAEAEQAINESLRLDPHDADAYAILGQSFLSRNRFDDALQAAERGLAIDPDHTDCGNLRSISLERLGRGNEAIQSASETLRRDPDDPMSHAAHGYTLLNSGKYREAQVAFREALRLDPQNEMARVGMINALNNRSFAFRMVHKFYVALSRLNSSAAFALIFGAWILVQVLSQIVAPAVPALRPLIFPIIAFYVLFVIFTWISQPLFNTFLRFHPFGQHLLNRSQRWASNLIAPSLALSLFGFCCGLYYAAPVLAILAAAYWVGLTIPISAAFLMPTRQRQWLVGSAALAIAILPAVGVAYAIWMNSSEPLVRGFTYFAYGLLAIQVASNLVAAKPVRQ